MKIKWKIIIALLVVALVVVIGGWYFYQTFRSPDDVMVEPKIILFYGIGCPHCAKVEAFLHTPKAKDISILTKEVYYDRTNLRDLISKAQKCGAIKNGMIPIPLLWEGNNQCVTGDKKVMQYLNNLVKQK